MDFDLKKIDALIIDLGGVILDIDIEGTFEKFKKLGIGPGQSGLHLIKQNDVFTNFEKGKYTPEQFRNEIRKVSKAEFSDEEFDEIWNSMILFYPVDRITALEKFRIKYRTFLMSNTNEIHFHSYSKMLCQSFGYDYLDDLFEKAYYSHTSGMRKPDVAFFKHILKENNLQAERTLFVDDFIENIEAAKSLNINTYHITNGHALVDLL
jgi:glucose-1-phosphatase